MPPQAIAESNHVVIRSIRFNRSRFIVSPQRNMRSSKPPAPASRSIRSISLLP